MFSTLLVRKPRWRGGVGLVPFALAALALLLFVSSCSEPITTPGEDPAGDATFEGSYDPQSGGIEFLLTAPPGQPLPPLRLVATDVQMDSAGLLHAQVAVRNLHTETVQGPAGFTVSHFLPATVFPVNAECSTVPGDSTDPIPLPPVPNPDSLPPDPVFPEPFPRPPCFFDHRGTYGDDGLLAGGETSDPLEWIFAGTGGESFAFVVHLAKEPIPAEGLITGIVFEDANENGRQDLSEPGIAGISVGLVVGDHVRIQTTDRRGRYAYEVPDAGLYRLSVTVPEGARATGPTELQVLIVRTAEGGLSNFMQGDFGLVTTPPWGELRIEGMVFLDLNRNGIRERGESGVAGVGVGASSLICMLPIAAQARTDANGFYRILGREVLCPLPWMVHRVPLEGHVGTTPDQVELLQPPPGGSVFRVDFGVAPEDSVQHPVNITITGVVFVDWDGNGRFDNNDEPLPGVQVQLLSPCDLDRSAVTDAMGRYVFEPDVVRMCPVTGVWQARPEYLAHTTPNPVEIQMPTVPGNHLFRVHFGIGPER